MQFRILSLLALSLVGVPLAQQSAAISEADFVAWVREAALPLDGLDWETVDLSPLEGLDQALEGKRIVYLGEPDHFIREKMDYRLILIRFLHARGWRYVGMEQGRSDGMRIDRYLETGDEALLDRVAIFGYEGFLREDRDDRVPGWTGGKNEDMRQKAVDEARWFVREMRRFNAGLDSPAERLHYFGFDVSMVPGGSYFDARALLEPHRADPLGAELWKRLERVEGESRQEEAARLDALAFFVDERSEELGRLLGPSGRRELRRSIVCLAEGLRFVDGFIGPFDTESKHATLARREENMQRQMDELLEQWGPEAKVILMGHDLHLSRESGRIEWDGSTMWPTIGTHLAHTRPGEVFAFWLLFESGVHGSPMADEPFRRVRRRTHDVERLLGKAGDLYVLPLHGSDPRSAFLDEPRDLLVGGFRARCALNEQADAIFFIEEVRPQDGR